MQDNFLRVRTMLIGPNGERMTSLGRSTGLTLTTVTHDFEIHAFVEGLTSESDADSLKFEYAGNHWFATVTDVSFTYQKLKYGELGATYELRGTVTFELIDYYPAAKALAECFITELHFRNKRITQGYRNLGGHDTAL